MRMADFLHGYSSKHNVPVVGDDGYELAPVVMLLETMIEESGIDVDNIRKMQ